MISAVVLLITTSIAGTTTDGIIFDLLAAEVFHRHIRSDGANLGIADGDGGKSSRFHSGIGTAVSGNSSLARHFRHQVHRALDHRIIGDKESIHLTDQALGSRCTSEELVTTASS